jgi:hypothetical protein
VCRLKGERLARAKALTATGAQSTRGSPLRAGETIALYLVLAAAALFPVLAVSFPPLADLPNHLARAHIIANLAHDSDLQRHYAIQWQLLSFQSTDLLLPPLAKLVGLETACRIFIGATFAALLGGVFALHKVLFGRVGLLPAAAFLVLYNFMLAWGLLSFLFTSGLSLILLAGWIGTAERQSALRSACFALGALVIFFFHFFAFAVFALALVAFEQWRWWRDRKQLGRRIILSGIVFVVPAVLFMLVPRSTIPLLNNYGNIDDKVRAILSPFNLYFAWPDYLLALSAIALFTVGRLKGLFVLALPIRWPVIAIVAATIVMPNLLMSVWGPDFRLPTIALLLLIGGTELTLKTRKQAAILACTLVALMLVRVGTVTAEWRRMADDLSELRAATATLDRGAKVVVVPSRYDHRNPPAIGIFPYSHFAAFAVIDRDVFLPHLFSAFTPLRFVSLGNDWTTDQFALVRKPEWRPRNPAFAAADAKTVREVEQVQQAIQGSDQATSTIDWSDWPEQFDYLVVFDYGRPENPVPALLTEFHRGSFFSIFRIHPPE